jgi:hypothetical protein
MILKFQEIAITLSLARHKLLKARADTALAILFGCASFFFGPLLPRRATKSLQLLPRKLQTVENSGRAYQHFRVG